ncbi:MAG: serine acetyltransferase [Acidobacteria bacterium]|nr:serine acetyltransferase [Acidobacteriota bacterium]
MTSPAGGERRDRPAWDIDRLVAALRPGRSGVGAAPELRGVDEPLPSRAAVTHVLDGLRAALFPMHFGDADLTEAGLDRFVSRTLDTTLAALRDQVCRELRGAARRAGADAADHDARASDIVRAFAGELPVVRALLESDLVAAYRGDPAAKHIDEILLCYPGVTAVVHYRLAHVLDRLGAPLIARMISDIAHSETAVDIHPGATIGASFFIDHGTGVVIGETAVVGERVRLYQAVTLGAKRFEVDAHGALVKGVPRHPVVEDDVVIYAGATILGRVTIGKGSTIGGNVWLTRSVPPGSQITQALARSDVFDAGAGI